LHDRTRPDAGNAASEPPSGRLERLFRRVVHRRLRGRRRFDHGFRKELEIRQQPAAPKPIRNRNTSIQPAVLLETRFSRLLSMEQASTAQGRSMSDDSAAHRKKRTTFAARARLNLCRRVHAPVWAVLSRGCPTSVRSLSFRQVMRFLIRRASARLRFAHWFITFAHCLFSREGCIFAGTRSLATFSIGLRRLLHCTGNRAVRVHNHLSPNKYVATAGRRTIWLRLRA